MKFILTANAANIYFSQMNVRQKLNPNCARSRKRPLNIKRREGAPRTILTNIDPKSVDRADEVLGRFEVSYPALDGADPGLKVEVPVDAPKMIPPPSPYADSYDQCEDELEFHRKLTGILSVRTPDDLHDEDGLRILTKRDLSKLCMMITGVPQCRLETIISDEGCDCLGSLPGKIQVAKIWLVDGGEAYDMRQKYFDCFEALSSYVCTLFISYNAAEIRD